MSADDTKELLEAVLAKQEQHEKFMSGMLRAFLHKVFDDWQDALLAVQFKGREPDDAELDHLKLEAASRSIQQVTAFFDEPVRSQLLSTEDELIAQILAIDEAITSDAPDEN